MVAIVSLLVALLVTAAPQFASARSRAGLVSGSACASNWRTVCCKAARVRMRAFYRPSRARKRHCRTMCRNTTPPPDQGRRCLRFAG